LFRWGKRSFETQNKLKEVKDGNNFRNEGKEGFEFKGVFFKKRGNKKCGETSKLNMLI